MPTGYKAQQPFEDYIRLSARIDKIGPRTEAIIYMRNAVAAGLFPGRVRNFVGAFSRWLDTIPMEHRYECGKVYRQYLSINRTRQAVRAQKREALLKKPRRTQDVLRRQCAKKSFNMWDFLNDTQELS